MKRPQKTNTARRYQVTPPPLRARRSTSTRHGALRMTRSTVAPNTPRRCGQPLPRRAEDDDLHVAPGGLRDDLDRRAAPAHEPWRDAHAVRVAERDRLVELVVRLPLELLERACRSGARAAPPPRSARSRARAAPSRAGSATSSASSDGLPGTIGTRIRRYSSASAAPTAGGALTVLAHRLVEEPLAVDDVAGCPDREPAEPHPPRCRVLEEDHSERDPCRNASEDCEQRPVDAPSLRFGRARYSIVSPSRAAFIRNRTIDTCATVNERVAPNE